MVFEHVEKLKQEYTDKYVIVDDSRPELRRFKGMTGSVKTVNMNGRALVQFDANNNIGWYDIDVDFLRVVDAPPPEPEEEEPAKKAAGKAAEAPKKRGEKAPAEAPAVAADTAAGADPAEKAEAPASEKPAKEDPSSKNEKRGGD
jgi:hypothetical protein